MINHIEDIFMLYFVVYYGVFRLFLTLYYLKWDDIREVFSLGCFCMM